MATPDSAFEKVYNPKLLARLEQRFGPFQAHHAEVSASTKVMLSVMEKMESKGRRGEVVITIPDEEGRVWLHTKDFYPQGIYRLMTGGIKPKEAPDEAFLREAREETGLQVKIKRCLAVVTYQFQNLETTLPFVSYLFLAKSTSHSPKPADIEENITDFKAVPGPTLLEVAQQLWAVEGDFADWGRFRAVAHEIAGRYFETARS
jgi:8-oxo-dGTP pyrophosphatase MutT (NUDIX family)